MEYKNQTVYVTLQLYGGYKFYGQVSRSVWDKILNKLRSKGSHKIKLRRMDNTLITVDTANVIDYSWTKGPLIQTNR